MPYKPVIPEPPPLPFAETVKSYPSFDIKSARRIRALLRQHRAKRLPQVSTVSSKMINPKHLLPIHLRTGPLRPLSPTTEEFAKQFGARDILKRRRSDWSNHNQNFQNQLRPPPRKESWFVDDSAVEVDSEGEHIHSVATTPIHSPPTSSPRASPITTSRGWGFDKFVKTQTIYWKQEAPPSPPPDTTAVVSRSAQSTPTSSAPVSAKSSLSSTDSPALIVKKSKGEKPNLDSACLICGEF